MMNTSFYDVVLSPVITEKSTVASENNQIIFYVSRKSTKLEIKQAVEKIFSVRVVAVNTLIKKGKVKNFRRVKARQQDVKKAIVTLAEGEIIDISEKI